MMSTSRGWFGRAYFLATWLFSLCVCVCVRACVHMCMCVCVKDYENGVRPGYSDRLKDYIHMYTLFN